ncbi:MAG: transporter substrate-binding domain-containing protein [Spirochaetaceae bacterium]|nr:transporter substrate-binding domain-containing protein [Spirochaetaceae bacterium]
MIIRHNSTLTSRIFQILTYTPFLFFTVFLIITPSVHAVETVRVGYFEKKPVTIINNNGQPKGLAIDILSDIAKENNWKLEYIQGSLSDSLNRLKSGKVDLMIPIGHTESRQKVIDYSDKPILQSWGCLFTKYNGSIKSLKDVSGKRIAFVKNSMFYTPFYTITEGLNLTFEFVEVSSYSKLFSGIKEGRFEGGIGDRLALAGLDQELSRIIDGSIVFHPFALHAAVVKGDPKNLLKAINNYLIKGESTPDSSYFKHLNYWLSGMSKQSDYLISALFIVLGLIIFIFIIYLLLRISSFRKALGLTEVIQPQVSTNILITAGVLSVIIWSIDILAEYFLFNKGTPFITIFISQQNPHEIFMHLLSVGTVLFGGIVISRIFARLSVAQSRAEESAENLHTTLNSIGDAVIATDTEGIITRMNSVAESLTGWKLDEAKGKALTSVFHIINAHTGKPTVNPVNQVIEKDEIIGLANHTLLISKDGTNYHISDSAAPIRSIDRTITGVVLVFRDVTEKKQLEEMMIQNEKMLSVGGLAAGMAHEINNPLAGMMQSAEVISMRLGKNKNLQANIKAAEEAGTTMEVINTFMEARNIPRMLVAINESGKRVTAIIDNMLSFARKDENQKSSHDINKLLDRTIELAASDYNMKKQYDFKQIIIQKKYARDLPMIPCEGAKIQQVLLNILRNGSQAMHKADINHPQFVIRTRFEKENKLITVEIEDNGPGMDEKIRKRVFEPFFTTKPVGEGTGLGLSVSYFIITENHDGKMSVESRKGEGTKFIISLPAEGAKP